MGKIITVSLPHDLPENWNDSQYVSPGGTEVGLTPQHGYNYLMEQVNAAQKAITEIDDAAGSLIGANLLINPYFVNPVDRRHGHMVPQGTLYYTDKELTTVGGSIAPEYQTVYYVDGVYGLFTYEGVTYYINWSNAVRGYAGSGYGIERWRSNNPNNYYVIEPGGLRFTMYAGARFYQTVELPAGTYTFSVLAEAVTESKLGIEAPVGVFTTMNTGVTSATFTLTEPMSFNTYISSESGGTALIKAVKLEVGTHQTLAYQDEFGNWILNDITNHALERAKCSQHDVVTAVTTNEQINSVVAGWIYGMSDHQIGNFVLSVESLGLILGGGAWFITVNKASAAYATVMATRYDVSGMLIKVCSMNAGVLSGWATITPASVAPAVLESEEE